METVASPTDLDDVDRGLIHALQIDGRVAARTVGAVLGVSESTVARRYHRLRGDGRLRVVGTLDGSRLGYSSWLIRLLTTPDAATGVAGALARRGDTSWIYLLSGGTEVLATTQSRDSDARDELLLGALPRTRRVRSMTAHCLLTAFTLPQTWSALAALTDDQVEGVRAMAASPAPYPDAADRESAPVHLDAGDQAMIRSLARDGRATHAELAAASGFSESTVRRRLAALRSSGVLALQLDIDPAVLGYRTQARLWMTVRPRELTRVAEALARHPEVAFVAVTTGASNLTAALVCRTEAHLYRYLTESVASLEGIQSVETAPVIRTVKRNAEPRP